MKEICWLENRDKEWEYEDEDEDKKNEKIRKRQWWKVKDGEE